MKTALYSPSPHVPSHLSQNTIPYHTIPLPPPTYLRLPIASSSSPSPSRTFFLSKRIFAPPTDHNRLCLLRVPTHTHDTHAHTSNIRRRAHPIHLRLRKAESKTLYRPSAPPASRYLCCQRALLCLSLHYPLFRAGLARPQTPTTDRYVKDLSASE